MAITMQHAPSPLTIRMLIPSNNLKTMNINNANRNQLSKSMVIRMPASARVSLIDNTLAQSFTMKRARARSSSSGSLSSKTKSEAKFSYKNRTPGSNGSTGSTGSTVKIFSTNSHSPSSSSADLMADAAAVENMDPYAFIESVLIGNNSSSSTTAKQQAMQPLHESQFLPLTDEKIAAYSNDAIMAVRSSDLATLRAIHASGRSLDCCNRFGESLLHVACRRSTPEVVNFLLNEAHVSPRIKDDYGRTPLHDACWRGNPEYDVVEMLLAIEPKLAFVKDVRGHGPFQYARREHWGGWRNFLQEKRDLILK